MALALNVSADAARDAALLTVSGLTSGASVTISRTGPSNNPAGVRGAVGAPVSPPIDFLTHDYEIPLDVSVTYTATVYSGAGGSGSIVGTASAIYRVPYDDCLAWLVDIGRPLNSLQVLIESLRELDYAVPAGIHRVLNRRAPVVTALPAWTPSLELIVLSDTLAERDRLRDLFGSGFPILLRTDPGQGVGNLYLGLVQFVEERFLSQGVAPQRRFRASCVQVERPDPSTFAPVAPNFYAAVTATWADYAALKAGVATYDGLAYSYPAGAGFDPWLPDDV